MQRHSRFAAVALAGVVAAGSLAATLTSASPALADDHHSRGGYGDRGRGHVVYRRDYHRDDRRGWGYPAPAYYPAPVYPAYSYPAYAPSNGYVHVSTPGLSLGFHF
jgi:hypothetical protein